MKKKTTYLLIAILITLIVVLVLAKRATPPGPTPSPALTFDQIPQFPAPPLLNQEPIVTFTISAPLPQVPENLPTYTLSSPPISLPQAQTIAQAFGFVTEPKIEPTLSFTAYSWSSATGTKLSIQNSPPALAYSQPLTPTPPAPSFQAAQTIVLNFLQSKNLLNPNTSLQFLTGEFLRVSQSHPEPASAATGNLTLVSLQYLVNNFPLYLEPKSPPSITALVANTGPSSLSVKLPPQLTPLTDTPPISPNLAVEALQNSKGALVEVDYQAYGDAGQGTAFSEVNITTIDLVYVLDKSSSTAKPTYRFSGTALNKTNNKPISVVYFVIASL